MMEIVQIIIAFIVALGILVTIHEFGHFWVARRCGVKVLRFAWGFGSPLFKWNDRFGTEFAICALPLGGYVKMLDEREGHVESDQLKYSFNQQSVYKRIAIAFAGPLANFLFAIAVYWLLVALGPQAIIPVLGDTPEDSPAGQAGLPAAHEIVAVDGHKTLDWPDVNLQLLKRLGDSGLIQIEVREPDSAAGSRFIAVPINNWLTGVKDPDPMGDLGITIFRPKSPAIIKEIVAAGAAEKSGMQVGDRVVSINGQNISDSAEFVAKIQQAPEVALQMIVLRDGEEVGLSVTPELSGDDRQVGLIGVMLESAAYPDAYKRTYGFSEGIVKAVATTWDTSVVILSVIKKLLLGSVSIDNLGGPITIANAAGTSASYGLDSFLSFLAYLSVSLGVLNLLPIPMLDGGHLLYYFIEILKGKPLSEEVQTLGLKIGMALIAIIMVFAFYNDLSRI